MTDKTKTPRELALEAIAWSRTLIKFHVKTDKCVFRGEDTKSALEIYKLLVEAYNALSQEQPEPIEITKSDMKSDFREWFESLDNEEIPINHPRLQGGFMFVDWLFDKEDGPEWFKQFHNLTKEKK